MQYNSFTSPNLIYHFALADSHEGITPSHGVGLTSIDNEPNDRRGLLRPLIHTPRA